MIRLFRPSDIDTIGNNRGWFVGLGIVYMVLGVIALLLPFLASLVTTILIGWLMLFAGISEGYHAYRNREWAGSGWEVVSAVVQILAGGYVVLFPLAGKVMLTLALAIYFFVEGILKVIRGFQHRAVYAWGWLVFDGLLSMVLGLFILLRWPSVAMWTLGLLVGIHFFMGGSSMLLIGLGSSRREARL